MEVPNSNGDVIGSVALVLRLQTTVLSPLTGRSRTKSFPLLGDSHFNILYEMKKYRILELRFGSFF